MSQTTIKLTSSELEYLRYLMNTAAGTELDPAFDTPATIRKTTAVIKRLNEKLGTL